MDLLQNGLRNDDDDDDDDDDNNNNNNNNNTFTGNFSEGKIMFYTPQN